MCECRVNTDPEHSVKDKIRASRVSNNDRKGVLDKLMGSVSFSCFSIRSDFKFFLFLTFTSLFLFPHFHAFFDVKHLPSLSKGKLKRLIGIKVRKMGGNAVIGYRQVPLSYPLSLTLSLILSLLRALSLSFRFFLISLLPFSFRLLQHIDLEEKCHFIVLRVCGTACNLIRTHPDPDSLVASALNVQGLAHLREGG